MAESYSKFNLERNSPAVSQTGCATLHSYQPCVRVPVVPHPCQHLALSAFVVICCAPVILRVALWCIAAFLLCISLMTDNAEHLFMCVLAILVSSLVKCLFRPFAYFCIVLFVFLLLNCTMPNFLKMYLFKYS